MRLDPVTTYFLPAAPDVALSLVVVVVVAATGNRFDRGGVRFAKAESDVRFGRVDLSASTRRQRIDEWGGVRLLEETGSDE